MTLFQASSGLGDCVDGGGSHWDRRTKGNGTRR